MALVLASNEAPKPLVAPLLMLASQNGARQIPAAEAVMCGDYVQAVSDALILDDKFYMMPLYGRNELLSKLRLKFSYPGYTITRYLYSVVDADTNTCHWQGFIAKSDAQDANGTFNIVVAIRGTAPAFKCDAVWDALWQKPPSNEWEVDLTAELIAFPDVGDCLVHKGFLGMYTTSKSNLGPFVKTSLQKQIQEELEKLAASGEKVKIMFTGHSLGGALATLAACDVAVNFAKRRDNVDVTLFTFGSPRVGNPEFKHIAESHMTNIWRYANKGDGVPFLPPKWMPFNWHNFCDPNIYYEHVGQEVKLDPSESPYVRGDLGSGDCHNLQLYLHLAAATTFTSNSLLMLLGKKPTLEESWKKAFGADSESLEKLEKLEEFYGEDRESLETFVHELASLKAKKEKEEEKFSLPATKRLRLSSVSVFSAAIKGSPYDARDKALLNLGANLLRPEFNIPEAWRVRPVDKDMVFVEEEHKWLPRGERTSDIPFDARGVPNPNYFCDNQI